MKQGFLGGSMVKNPPAMQGIWARSLVQETPRATKRQARASQLLTLRSRAREPQRLRPSGPRAPPALQQEKPLH